MRKSTRVILVLLVLALVAGGVAALVAANNAKRARLAALYAQADADMAAGRYAEAMAAFETLKQAPYKDAVTRFREAREALLEQRRAAGDWDGVLELAADGDDARDATANKAEAMAREGRADEALAYLDGEEVRARFNGSFENDLALARARVLAEAGRWAEAEEIYREYAMKGSAASERVSDDIDRCIRGRYLDAVRANDDAEAQAMLDEARRRYGNCSDREPEILREVLLAPIRADLERGAFAEAADAIYALGHDGDVRNCAQLKAELEALADETFDACLAARDWAALIASDVLHERFEALSREDDAMARAFYLAQTDRAELIDADADFNALMTAPHGDYVILNPNDPDRLFTELYYAGGDPAEQYAAARTWAREHGREADFLVMGMDLAAAAAAGEELPVPLRAETIALLPAATEVPGKAKAWDNFRIYDLMPEGSHQLDDFRAKEPRPGYYAVVVTTGSWQTPLEQAHDPSALLDRAGSAMKALAKAGGGDPLAYRCVGNPNAAAFLVRVSARFDRAGTFGPDIAGGALSSQLMEGYVESVEYDVYDTRTGERLAHGIATAQIPAQVFTKDYKDDKFWRYADAGDFDASVGPEEAGAVCAANDALVRALTAE